MRPTSPRWFITRRPGSIWPIALESRRGSAMSKTRLLLVEDDRALADLVTFHFDRAGYEVTRTGDGEEALILVDEVRPDVILLDWMSEGISGIEVCRRLRRRSSTANVPIMMLTARGDESDR